MSDDLEKGLIEVQTLVHRQVEQIRGIREECARHQFDDEFTRKSFLRLFEIAEDFYMNLESMYIANEASARQTDSIKDAIFSLNEVRNNPTLQDKFNKLFSSHVEALKEVQKSFMKTYGIDEV